MDLSVSISVQSLPNSIKQLFRIGSSFEEETQDAGRSDSKTKTKWRLFAEKKRFSLSNLPVGHLV